MSKTPEWKKFEESLARVTGARTQPGSGNGPFRKLDVEGVGFLLSAKWTDNASIRLDSDTLTELQEASRGPGSPNLVPLAATRIKDAQDGSEKVYVTLELNELLSLLEEGTKLFKQSKRDAKYESAKTPSLLRE